MTQAPANTNNLFVLQEVAVETGDTSTFRFIPESGEMFPFTAGQYVTLYILTNDFGGQGKDYTITSLPGEKHLELTVKKQGNFSAAIHNLQPGDKVKILGPYGNFYPTEEMTELVFLAGGVGVTPFYAVTRDLESRNKLAEKKIHLFHSCKRKDDIIFLEKFVKLSGRRDNFRIIHTVTQEENAGPPDIEKGRIDWEMIKKHSGEIDDKNYFLCGSISFVRDLWQELKRRGVKEENIFTESFY